MITLTEIAANKTQEMLNRRGYGLGIRIGVKSSGCNGMKYLLEYVDQSLDTDQVYTSYNINIYVDPESLPYIQGLTMDWRVRGLNQGFEFINPQEQSRCGCGESFSVHSGGSVVS